VLLFLAAVCACGPLLAADKIIVDDFEKNKEGQFPIAWSLRKEFWQIGAKAAKVLVVRSENGNKYLAADSNGDSWTAGKVFSYDLSEYRFLSWRWRARVLPKGGDESKKITNDSAAGLYVCFKGFVSLPYCIKYVWSSTVPAGTVLDSPHRKATKIVVLRSGPQQLGTWVKEKRDVYADYLKVFRTKAVKNPVGIAVLTDSDDTRSRAAADYDDIAVSRE
jgi:hypothetical protein